MGWHARAAEGFLPLSFKKKYKNQKEAEKQRGLTKATVLKGDAAWPNLVAFTAYDTKPVHFLTMSCTELKWIEKAKVVFDKKEEKCVKIRFLRCSVNGDYNNGMNGVDIADQIWDSFHIDRWMQKGKWWWSIWMWGVQVLLVNAYVLYKTAHLYMWKKNKKSIMSQYDFHHQIALDWLMGSETSSQGKCACTISDYDSVSILHCLLAKQGGLLMHCLTQTMAVFTCNWMMTSTFLSQALPVNNLAAAYVDGLKEIKIT